MRLSIDDDLSLIVWPLCLTEVADIEVMPIADAGGVAGLRFEIATCLAGDLTGGKTLRYEGLYLDLARRSWEQTPALVQQWYRALGVSLLGETPGWVAAACLFEVFIGRAVFWGGKEYAPYPTVADLQADLDRIQALGMTAIQIMPQHPYPSYSIHDFDDVSTSYGDEKGLKKLIAECHRRGMRVVLDVLLHGVIDGESITTAAERVRTGDVAPMLDRSPGDLFAAGSDEGWRYEVAWSRHILDFEPYWVAGSPAVSPLTVEHPDWFYRDSSGAVAGVYTKAIDVRNVEARRWMIDSLCRLAERLDVDGFRLDAPTYNRFANWSTTTRHRASASTLACLELFRELRPMIKGWKGDFMLYTEPSGILHREAMDVTYNYDEQWLVGAGLGAVPDRAQWAVSDARSMAEWLCDRDALLPAGSLTCHHVDSHDTFWWPEWGDKWRREQFGVDPTAAMMAVFMLCGGPYMTFVGGEQGLEVELEALARVRRENSAISLGVADYQSISCDSDQIFAIVRRDERTASVVLVNLSAAPVRSVVHLDGVGRLQPALFGSAGGRIDEPADELTVNLAAHTWCVLSEQET